MHDKLFNILNKYNLSRSAKEKIIDIITKEKEGIYAVLNFELNAIEIAKDFQMESACGSFINNFRKGERYMGDQDGDHIYLYDEEDCVYALTYNETDKLV